MNRGMSIDRMTATYSRKWMRPYNGLRHVSANYLYYS